MHNDRFANVRWVVFAVLVAAVIAGFSASASAHATLLSSTPANNEIVDAVPSEIVLAFDEAARVSGGDGVVILDPDGRESQVGEAEFSGESTVITQGLRGDSRGTYTVSYRLISEDNHVVAGSYVFHVGEVTGAAETSDNMYSTGWLVGVFGRAMYLGAVLLGLGSLVVAFRVDRAGTEPERWPHRRLWIGVAAACAGGSVLGLWGLGMELSDSLIPETVVMSDLIRPVGPWGGSALWLAAIVASALVVAAGDIRQGSRAKRVQLIAAVVFLGMVPSLSGHDSALSWVAVVVNMTHVFAASVWAGGLVYVAMTWESKSARRTSLAVGEGAQPALEPGISRASENGHRLAAFSSLAVVAVLVVVVSGALNAGLLVGGVSEFFESLGESDYSLTLAVKVALVFAMVILGWINRRTLASGANSLRNLPRTLRLEVLVVVAVVATTSVLAGMVPPTQSVPQDFQGVSQAGETTVRMQVYPAESGANEVHLYFLSLDGSLKDVEAAELRVGSDLVESRRIPVTMITASHAIVPQVDLAAGRWDFEVTVVASPAPPAAGQFEVEIG